MPVRKSHQRQLVDASDPFYKQHCRRDQSYQRQLVNCSSSFCGPRLEPREEDPSQVRILPTAVGKLFKSFLQITPTQVRIPPTAVGIVQVQPFPFNSQQRGIGTIHPLAWVGFKTTFRILCRLDLKQSTHCCGWISKLSVMSRKHISSQQQRVGFPHSYSTDSETQRSVHRLWKTLGRQVCQNSGCW